MKTKHIKDNNYFIKPKRPNKLSLDIGVEPFYWSIGIHKDEIDIWENKECVKHLRTTIDIFCFYIVFQRKC